MDKSTFSILFIMQKGKPNAEGNAPIFARITINHQMTHLATRYYLPPERWLPKEGRTVGRTKEEKEVNAYLDNLRGLIFAVPGWRGCNGTKTQMSPNIERREVDDAA